MADGEKYTAERNHYPEAMWTVVLRMSRGGDAPISPVAVEFLEGMVPTVSAESLSQRRHMALDDEGILYVRFDTWRPGAGEDVVREAMTSLHAGTRPMGLDLEVEAHMDFTRDVNPVLTDRDNFNVFENDVTLEAREVQKELKEVPYELDTSELEHLQDH